MNEYIQELIYAVSTILWQNCQGTFRILMSKQSLFKTWHECYHLTDSEKNPKFSFHCKLISEISPSQKFMQSWHKEANRRSPFWSTKLAGARGLCRGSQHYMKATLTFVLSILLPNIPCWQLVSFRTRFDSILNGPDLWHNDF